MSYMDGASPDEVTFKPIGYFHSSKKYKYDAPKQPERSTGHESDDSPTDFIELKAGQNFEQALIGIESCSHLWIIYSFHQNEDWKPMIQPPTLDQKIGVFATRAPYRPNPIGMSCVELKSVHDLKIFVGSNDLLDGTPILDIKPYHPKSDVISEASIGWLEESLKSQEQFKISFSPTAEEQLDFLEQSGVTEIRGFIARQLSTEPQNRKRKRLTDQNSYWTLSYRTWRIDFIVVDETVSIIGLWSGYKDEEIGLLEDPYNDKAVHRKFRNQFR